MSAAAVALRDFLAPLLPGYVLQFGEWDDDHANPAHRFAVIKPVGGGRAELVRRPQFTLSLIGVDAEDRITTSESADAVVEAMRSDSGTLVFLQPGEPVFMATEDRRPVFEIAVSAITT